MPYHWVTSAYGHTPHNLEVVGLNPSRCWDFFVATKSKLCIALVASPAPHPQAVHAAWCFFPHVALSCMMLDVCALDAWYFKILNIIKSLHGFICMAGAWQKNRWCIVVYNARIEMRQVFVWCKYDAMFFKMQDSVWCKVLYDAMFCMMQCSLKCKILYDARFSMM